MRVGINIQTPSGNPGDHRKPFVRYSVPSRARFANGSTVRTYTTHGDTTPARYGRERSGCHAFQRKPREDCALMMEKPSLLGRRTLRS